MLTLQFKIESSGSYVSSTGSRSVQACLEPFAASSGAGTPLFSPATEAFSLSSLSADPVAMFVRLKQASANSWSN